MTSGVTRHISIWTAKASSAWIQVCASPVKTRRGDFSTGPNDSNADDSTTWTFGTPPPLFLPHQNVQSKVSKLADNVGLLQYSFSSSSFVRLNWCSDAILQSTSRLESRFSRQFGGRTLKNSQVANLETLYSNKSWVFFFTK